MNTDDRVRLEWMIRTDLFRNLYYEISEPTYVYAKKPNAKVALKTCVKDKNGNPIFEDLRERHFNSREELFDWLAKLRELNLFLEGTLKKKKKEKKRRKNIKHRSK